MTYDTIPIKTLCILLDDESKIGKYDLNKDEWETIKQEYTELHPSTENEILMREYSAMIKNEVDEIKNLALLQFLLDFDGDAEDFFNAAGVKYTGDREEDYKYIQAQINKATQKRNIHKARCEKLGSDIIERRSKEQPKALKIQEVNEALVSLQLAGISIPDFEKFTAGQYDAANSVLRKKAAQNGK